MSQISESYRISARQEEQARSTASPRISVEEDNGATRPDVSVVEYAPQDAVLDSRPSRRYQIVLLVGAFFMIFQVMGINSVYGVFQVGDLLILLHFCLYAGNIFQDLSIIQLPPAF